jgi:pilus assembly protein CpaF
VAREAERVHRLLLEGAAPPGGADVAAEAAAIAELVLRADPLCPPGRLEAIGVAVRARLHGLGSLEPLLADPAVTDVMVNGPGPVWVDRGGVVAPSGVVVQRAELEHLVERIVAPLGRRADPRHAVVEGRLADGSRVHVVMPPVAVDGPCLTIRRFGARRVALAELAAPPVAGLLAWAVRARLNVIVSGATSTGKTTLLNALCAEIPSGERIVTIEDAAELRLAADHVVRLEARPSSPDGAPAVTARDLVRSALRMRPDRLIVGEVRGAEALEMVAAMSTGHDGSLSTVHANDATDAIRRLETLVLQAGVGLPLDAVRARLGSAVDLVVHLVRGRDGARRVAEVVEVAGAGPGAVATRTVARDGAVVAGVERPGRDASVPPLARPVRVAA